jgi:hypothetical protein
MWGSFSRDSLRSFSELIQAAVDEDGLMDFTRCMRADGSFYGTRGKCRKGSEALLPEEERKENVQPKRGSTEST